MVFQIAQIPNEKGIFGKVATSIAVGGVNSMAGLLGGLNRICCKSLVLRELEIK